MSAPELTDAEKLAKLLPKRQRGETQTAFAQRLAALMPGSRAEGNTPAPATDLGDAVCAFRAAHPGARRMTE